MTSRRRGGSLERRELLAALQPLMQLPRNLHAANAAAVATRNPLQLSATLAPPAVAIVPVSPLQPDSPGSS